MIDGDQPTSVVKCDAGASWLLPFARRQIARLAMLGMFGGSNLRWGDYEVRWRRVDGHNYIWATKKVLGGWAAGVYRQVNTPREQSFIAVFNTDGSTERTVRYAHGTSSSLGVLQASRDGSVILVGKTNPDTLLIVKGSAIDEVTPVSLHYVNTAFMDGDGANCVYGKSYYVTPGAGNTAGPDLYVRYVNRSIGAGTEGTPKSLAEDAGFDTAITPTGIGISTWAATGAVDYDGVFTATTNRSMTLASSQSGGFDTGNVLGLTSVDVAFPSLAHPAPTEASPGKVSFITAVSTRWLESSSNTAYTSVGGGGTYISTLNLRARTAILRWQDGVVSLVTSRGSSGSTDAYYNSGSGSIFGFQWQSADFYQPSPQVFDLVLGSYSSQVGPSVGVVPQCAMMPNGDVVTIWLRAEHAGNTGSSTFNYGSGGSLTAGPAANVTTYSWSIEVDLNSTLKATISATGTLSSLSNIQARPGFVSFTINDGGTVTGYDVNLTTGSVRTYAPPSLLYWISGDGSNRYFFELNQDTFDSIDGLAEDPFVVKATDPGFDFFANNAIPALDQHSDSYFRVSYNVSNVAVSNRMLVRTEGPPESWAFVNSDVGSANLETTLPSGTDPEVTELYEIDTLYLGRRVFAFDQLRRTDII